LFLNEGDVVKVDTPERPSTSVGFANLGVGNRGTTQGVAGRRVGEARLVERRRGRGAGHPAQPGRAGGGIGATRIRVVREHVPAAAPLAQRAELAVARHVERHPRRTRPRPPIFVTVEAPMVGTFYRASVPMPLPS